MSVEDHVHVELVGNLAIDALQELLELDRAMGCSPIACQIRSTADWVSPTLRAIERVDQCVASFGVDCSVFMTTSSTC